MEHINSQNKSTKLLWTTDSCPLLEIDWAVREKLFNCDRLDEYYPAVAIATLIRIIRDPNLSQHYPMVLQVSDMKSLINLHITV